jgi:hypothetical protein
VVPEVWLARIVPDGTPAAPSVCPVTIAPEGAGDTESDASTVSPSNVAVGVDNGLNGERPNMLFTE